MKKLLMLLILLLSLIITGCKTTEIEKLSFPPKPQRQELRKPENIREMVAVIVYYEFLVEEWECWAETVEHIAGVDDGSE